ncbi:deoxyribonuclease/rho motif-related TRAM [Methanohalobium evestigatum Z-7303]|uniref:Deoxyribonuclease/rho motif-related TRAM n=1 Tax=Methanohalobium evestigatum (strain ATCC BAA-1072 / DSM 3721 / NBRC 107634 / OCM 161 / Z-7303) TaxID=644295 RepID=D7E827_METEZ|nr:TRAM domain-containing protein [Methanohalobium evestigatum]ADI73369.1 deoxyribonuclease/rho motif-related TRAM [Methanohalobium evestigatum Z-7303]
MFNRDDSAPVRSGERYDVEIENIASKGDGIARVGGFVIFVPDTSVGDEVTIAVTKVMDNFAFGEIAQ